MVELSKLSKFINSKGYLCVKVGNRVINYHTYKYKLFRGTIPDGCQIHHIDFNKLNNNLNNLVCLTQREHAIIHKENRYGIKNLNVEEKCIFEQLQEVLKC